MSSDAPQFGRVFANARSLYGTTRGEKGRHPRLLKSGGIETATKLKVLECGSLQVMGNERQLLLRFFSAAEHHRTQAFHSS